MACAVEAKWLKNPWIHCEGVFISYSGGHLQHKTCVPILHLLPSCKIATCCTNGMSGSPVREESDLKCITRFSTRCTTQLIIPEAIKHNRSSVQYSCSCGKVENAIEPTCEGGDGAVARGGRRWRGWVGALGPRGRPPPPRSGLTTFCQGWAPGLVTNAILLCWLFTIKDRCKKVRFQQTHNQGLRQLLLTVSWDLRA